MREDIEQAILRNEKRPMAERMSNRAIAVEVGCNESSVRRARQRMIVSGQIKNDHGFDSFFGLPASAIQQRGRTVRLEDGSYEKVTYKPGAVEAMAASRLGYEEVERVLDRVSSPAFTPAPGPVDPTAPRTRVVCLSDWQLGKTDYRGGTPETVARIHGALQRIAQDLAGKGGVEELIVADCGDVCEGFWNVASQAQTNDLSLTDQIRTAQRLMAEAIRLLAPLCCRMVFVSVPSNHCQVRVKPGKGQRANAPDDDFGLLVADTLQAICEGRDGLGHVSFVRPEKWEEALTVRTADGTGVGFCHGHTAGSESRVPQWFAEMAFGHRSGLHDARILVHGHWHHAKFLTVGDGREVVGCPTMDNGSSWFANVSGQSEEPAILTFGVVAGHVEGWRLWRAEPV